MLVFSHFYHVLANFYTHQWFFFSFSFLEFHKEIKGKIGFFSLHLKEVGHLSFEGNASLWKLVIPKGLITDFDASIHVIVNN